MSRIIIQLPKWPKAPQLPKGAQTRQFPKWAKTLPLSIAIAIFAGIVVGIVIDPIRNFLKTVWNLIKIISNWLVIHVILQNLWPYGIFAIVVIVLTTILLYTRHDRDVKSHTLDMANKLLALDSAVLRMLPISTNATPDERKRILREVLRHILIVFGGPVERAAIFLLDPANPSSLICWVDYHMTEDDKNMRCDISNASQIQHDKGGVAGQCFLTGQILVAHLENRQWVCKVHTQHITFEETHPFSPYLSFVNVPIMRLDPITNTKICIGTLHLESRSMDTFDYNTSNPSNGAKSVDIILKELTSRLAALVDGSESTPAQASESTPTP